MPNKSVGRSHPAAAQSTAWSSQSGWTTGGTTSSASASASAAGSGSGYDSSSQATGCSRSQSKRQHCQHQTNQNNWRTHEGRKNRHGSSCAAAEANHFQDCEFASWEDQNSNTRVLSYKGQASNQAGNSRSSHSSYNDSCYTKGQSEDWSHRKANRTLQKHKEEVYSMYLCSDPAVQKVKEDFSSKECMKNFAQAIAEGSRGFQQTYSKSCRHRGSASNYQRTCSNSSSTTSEGKNEQVYEPNEPSHRRWVDMFDSDGDPESEDDWNRWTEVPTGPSWEEAAVSATSSESSSSSLDEEVTTLVIHGLPREMSREELMEEIDRFEYKGLYDYVFLPKKGFEKKNRTRYGFINWVSNVSAKCFLREWDEYEIAYPGRGSTSLRVVPAKVQGLQANMALNRTEAWFQADAVAPPPTSWKGKGARQSGSKNCCPGKVRL